MNNEKRKKLLPLFLLLAVIVVLAVVLAVENAMNHVTVTLTEDEAAVLIADSVKALPSSLAQSAQLAAEKLEVRVLSLTSSGKTFLAQCSYRTPDIHSVLSAHKNELLSLDTDNPVTGKPYNSTQIQMLLEEQVALLLNDAPMLEGETAVSLCETERGKVEVYFSDETVNALLGGILEAKKEISETNTIVVDGKEVDISTRNSLRNGLVNCVGLKNYDSQMPDSSGRLMRAFNSVVREFRFNFLDGDKWLYLAQGLVTTLEITGAAIAMGLVLGFLVAVVRVTNETTGKLYYIDCLCRAYLSVIRGTPVMVQLLIIHFVVLLPLGIPKFLSAVLCFGLNSGAYVAEIVRGGIMSVDPGQTEAGRSLGLTYGQTMLLIVIPQAFKAVLPALANEFIALLKETSVAFYIGVADLTQGGLRIRSITYSAFMPLIAVAVIYWVVVMFLTWLVSILERRLRKSERNNVQRHRDAH